MPTAPAVGETVGTVAFMRLAPLATVVGWLAGKLAWLTNLRGAIPRCQFPVAQRVFDRFIGVGPCSGSLGAGLRRIRKPAERRYSNSAGFAVHSTRRMSEPVASGFTVSELRTRYVMRRKGALSMGSVDPI